jgi:hypothetical protein
MASSGILRRVALVRTDVSEELSAFFNRVARVGELGSMCRLLVTASGVPNSPILVTLMMEALSSSETSVLTRAPRRNIPEDAILHSHRRENLKSYVVSPLISSSASPILSVFLLLSLLLQSQFSSVSPLLKIYK